MKNILIVSSFIAFHTIFTGYTYAQNLAANKMTELATGTSPSSLLVTVFQTNEDRFAIKVHFENHAKGSTIVKLKSSGFLLHKEVVETATYVRKYDMLNLPVGDYKIEVENEHQVYTKKITIRIENGRRLLTLI